MSVCVAFKTLRICHVLKEDHAKDDQGEEMRSVAHAFDGAVTAFAEAAFLGVLQ